MCLLCSQAKKLESSGAIKEERYKELCKLVIEAFTKDEGSLQYEALGALNIIVNEFQAHSLHLFESILQTDKRTRFVLSDWYTLFIHTYTYVKSTVKFLYPRL